MIELMISLVILGGISTAAFAFYQAQHQLYMSQIDITERQGNLRYATDRISHDIRNAGYLVPGPGTLRISAGFDTLEVYRGDSAGVIDTVQYYIDRSLDLPNLVKKINQNASVIMADGIDSALFVPAGTGKIERVSIVLVSVEQTQYQNSALMTRRRLGTTTYVRNR